MSETKPKAAKFRYSMSSADYSAKMEGTIRGPGHAAVVTAVLSGQFSDDASVLDAAPAMLEALKTLAEVLNGRVHSQPALSALIRAEEVIAKAEGRS